MSAVVCVCVCVGGWLAGYLFGACAGADGRKSMCSGGIFLGFLNCSHSVYKVMN